MGNFVAILGLRENGFATTKSKPEKAVETVRDSETKRKSKQKCKVGDRDKA